LTDGGQRIPPLPARGFSKVNCRLWISEGYPHEEPTVPNNKKADIPRLVVPKNATLRQIYAIARKEFTAADLQKYTEIEPMVPMEQVLAEMEKIHRQPARKRMKK
jgi:hypothetical protein